MSPSNRFVPSSNSANITPVKKCHTLKVQLIICWVSLQILSVICRKGKVHDFRILKESRLAINRETEKLADGGYQGIDKVYPNSVTYALWGRGVCKALSWTEGEEKSWLELKCRC